MSAKEVKLGQIKSKEEWTNYANELDDAISFVDRLIKEPVPDARLVALGSFITLVAFTKSTMLKRPNNDDVLDGFNELIKWD